MNKQGKIAKTASKAAPVVDIIKKISEIKAECARVQTVGAALQQDIHRLACSVLKHTAQHGRIQVLEQFIDAMPAMVRVNSLQLWFETFGQLTYNALEGEKKRAWRIDRSKKLRLGEAMEKPFWKFKALEGAQYTPIKMDDYLDQQIKKLEKDIKAVPVQGAADIRATLLASFKQAKVQGLPALN